MREVALNDLKPGLTGARAAFVACLATVLELTPGELPDSADVDEHPPGPLLSRWLARLGMGFVPVSRPDVFNWPGPWLARARDVAGFARPVVMYGSYPSGVVYDPLSGEAWPDEPGEEHGWVQEGFVIAVADIASARPPRATAPTSTGTLVSIYVADGAGEPARSLTAARLLPGQGVEAAPAVLHTGATLSHMEIGVRDLRNRTSQVIDAVRAGERVTLTVHGEPVADIVPHGRRARWLSGEHLGEQLRNRAADPALTHDLDDLAGRTLDEL